MSVTARKTLRRFFGYTSFRGCQEDVIRAVLSGRHALVIMPTGGGKSLCYQIPALMDQAAREDQDSAGGTSPEQDDRAPLTLVLSPLIALMKDQVDALRKRGVEAAYINSSLSRPEREERYRQVRDGKFCLLYVTPERFRKAEFVEVLARRRIKLLAVDEAHCISEWGHDFRPDYTRLREFRRLIGDPVTIALTATATPEVQQDIIRQLGLSAEEVAQFHEGIERPNLTLDVREVWGDDGKLDQIKTMAERHAGSGSSIVYFTLIKTLERFSERLRRMKIPHLNYHGDLERQQRRRVQNDFMSGRCPLVLATPAFGMGIDKEDIRFVLHAEIPGSMEAWYQEVGRAGRDGKPADCLLLYDESDLMTQMEFIQWSNPDADIYETVFSALRRDLESFHAFGMDWLRERLHIRSRHDRRLETALAMLERYGVIEGSWEEPVQLSVTGELPEELLDPERLAEKLRRDQQKLYALVQFIRHDGDRKQFLHEYFGLTSAQPTGRP